MACYRLILKEQAETLRFALFATTSGWTEIEKASEPVDYVMWQTATGALVSLIQDELLGRPVVDVSAPDDVPGAMDEARALTGALPEVFAVIAHDDVLANYASAGDRQHRAGMLPMVAATTDDPLTAGADDRRTARILTEALRDADPAVRVLAATSVRYAPLASLRPALEELAVTDPDQQVREAARDAARRTAQTEAARGSQQEPVPSAKQRPRGFRRITFADRRVDDRFVPFATARGWRPATRPPADQDHARSWHWTSQAGVLVDLVDDKRLDREYVSIAAGADEASAAEGRDLDEVESAIKTAFPAVTIDQAIAWLEAATNPIHALHALSVLGASAPGEYHPGWLRAIVATFGNASAGLREFAAGLTAYAPWPQLTPFLDWLACRDPDGDVRETAGIGLRFIPDDAPRPTTVFYALEGAGQGPGVPRLFRRVLLAPTRIDQVLARDKLWHPAELADEPGPEHEVISADRAAAIAEREYE